MNYWLFLLICLIATASPGPAVFLALKNGAFYGFKKSIFGILGNVSAMITMAFISAVGLGALILASTTLFLIIKIIGAVYLIYLGIKTFRNNSFYQSKNSDKLLQKSAFSLFREAYFVGISNPKAIVFFTALFPQFLDLEKEITLQFFILTITFAFFSFLFLSLYSLMATKLKKYLLKESIRKWFNRILGSLFISFGVSIAAATNK